MSYPMTRRELAHKLRKFADQVEDGGRAGILLPLYIRPGAPWDRVAAAKLAHPRVSIIAIANPRNGPGEAKSETYAAAIPKLAASGVVISGYVHTEYGLRAMDIVERDMRRWRDWYPETDSVFIDEFAAKPEHLPYYRTVQKLADQIGFRCLIGNPGTRPDAAMFDTADVLVVSERAEPPTVDLLESIAADGGAGQIGVLVHGAASTVVETWLPTAKRLLSYVYITQDVKPSPWDTITPQFEREIEILDQ